MPILSTIPWWVYAIAGAVFAGLTNVFIKAGMKGVNSELATAARTTIAVPIVWFIATIAAPKISEVVNWTARNWLFITLSALASGLSWICMYKSISMPEGGVTRTLPIDKSSIAFGFILAVLFLRERPTWQSTVAMVLVLCAVGVSLIPDKKSPDVMPPLTTQSVTK